MSTLSGEALFRSTYEVTPDKARWLTYDAVSVLLARVDNHSDRNTSFDPWNGAQGRGIGNAALALFDVLDKIEAGAEAPYARIISETSAQGEARKIKVLDLRGLPVLLDDYVDRGSDHPELTGGDNALVVEEVKAQVLRDPDARPAIPSIPQAEMPYYDRNR